ncbi:MAG: glycosyltransferase, exosortase A system-associated [Magnetococcales bacterium]|nr:glycosyltransferase, exosortase A system-associated [Magnetococcales bacterium]
MRILHVLDHSAPLQSGYVFRTLAILEYQQALGWETAAVTGPKQGPAADGSLPLEETAAGVRFFRTPPAPWAGWPLVGQWSVVQRLGRRLEGLIDQLRPDVIHAHSPALNGLAALRAARRTGLPVVYEVRALWEDAAVDHGTSRPGGLRYRATRVLETHVLRRARGVVTICEGLRREILARGVAAHRVTVVPNAVDPDRFAGPAPRDPELAQRLGLTDRTVLGFIGSFYGYEGLDCLLEALVRIRQARAAVALLLVGGGPREADLRRQAAVLGLENAVVFAGRVPHNEVERYYGLVDLFVYPRLSRRVTELVTPLKPLEAMAGSKPVAASSVGGHRELIDDGRTGFLFPPGDPVALATRLLELLEHREAWPEVCRRARTFVERERSWPAAVARYRSVYEP